MLAFILHGQVQNTEAVLQAGAKTELGSQT